MVKVQITGNMSIRGAFGHSIRWYEKILLLVLVIGIIAFVLFLGGLAAVIIIRIVLPVAVLFFVIKLISDYFRRG